MKFIILILLAIAVPFVFAATTTNPYSFNLIDEDNFLILTDTPGNYTGAADLCVKVNPAQTGLLFEACNASIGNANATGLILNWSDVLNGTSLLINWGDFLEIERHDQDLNTTANVTFVNATIQKNFSVGTFFLVDSIMEMIGMGTTTALEHTLTLFGDFDLHHNSTFDDDHAVEIEIESKGFGNVKAIDIDYITGNLSEGQDNEAILINFDQSEATGGELIGLEILTTEGSAEVFGLELGVLVHPIAQASGIFANMDSALNGTTDVLAAFISSSNDVALFQADNVGVTIGNTERFNEIEFLLNTTASGAGIKPIFEFSTGVDAWTQFTPTDTTNGMRTNGVIIYSDALVRGWAVGTGSEFLIRINRTRNSLTTVPIEDKVQISSTTEYFWNEDGDIVIRNLSLNRISAIDWSDVLGSNITNDLNWINQTDILANLSLKRDVTNSTFLGNVNISEGNLSVDGNVNIFGNLSVGSGDFFVNNNTGNVGIGTANPQSRLEVQTDTAFLGGTKQLLLTNINALGDAGLSFNTTNITTNLWQIFLSDADNRLTIGRDNVGNYLNIKDGGNVGIGTVSPSSKLDVNGNVSLNNTLFVNENGNVGIGTSTPVSPLEIQSLAASMRQTRYSNTGVQSAGLTVQRSGGTTVGTDVIVQDGWRIANFNLRGYDSATYRTAASIQAFIDGTPGVGDMPGRLTFLTTADGASSATERMRIDSSGNVGIGTIPSVKFHVLESVVTTLQARIENTLADGRAIFEVKGDSAFFDMRAHGTNYNEVLFGINMSDTAAMIGRLGKFIIGTFENEDLIFGTNNIERMRIENDGSVITLNATAVNLGNNLNFRGGTATVSGPVNGELNINSAGTNAFDLNNGAGGSVRLFVDHSGSLALQIFDTASSSNDFLSLTHDGNKGIIDTSSASDALQLNSNSAEIIITTLAGIGTGWVCVYANGTLFRETSADGCVLPG